MISVFPINSGVFFKCLLWLYLSSNFSMASIASLNVNGIRDPAKRFRIFEFCKQFGFDFVFLQETHIASDFDVRSWGREWGGGFYASLGSPLSCGTIILTKNFYRPFIRSVQTDFDGRVVSLIVDHPSIQARLCNVYAPTVPSMRGKFFNDLDSFVSGRFPCFLGGDFNCIESWGDCEVIYPSSTLTRGASALSALLQAYGLIDAWHSCPRLSSPFTFRSFNVQQATRIDRIYISKSRFSPTSVKVVGVPFSDHDCVVLNFALPGPSKVGPGYWKFNTRLLDEPNFQESFSDFYEGLRTLKPAFDCLTDWWDAAKVHIKRFIIEFACDVAKGRRARFRSLCDLYRGDPTNQSVLDELNQILDVKLEGARIRAHKFQLEGGERPSKSFLRGESMSSRDRFIPAVYNAAGDLVSDSDKIVSVFLDFYRNLFSSEPVDVSLQDTLLNNIVSTIPPDVSSVLDAPIVLPDLQAAVKAMHNDKSPGSDGLSVEFYKTFAHLVLPDLLDVFNDVFVSGLLSDSQRGSIITLVPKSGDVLNPANRRPISLLNVDYKILSKILSTRLRSVLSYIVNEYQVCAVHGRTVLHNLLVIRDLVSFVNSRGLDCALLSLDQEKAFDRVDHEFLFKCLNRFGFGEAFIRWIRILYTDCFARVLVNGFLSDTFFLHRGVRQGCPLSPALYVLFSECFARLLQSSGDFPGFVFPGSRGQRVKCLQYADDVTCVVTSRGSFRFLSSAIAMFEKGTGSKLNLSKTKGLRLGRWKGVPLPFPVTWTDGNLKINGVWFGNLRPDHQTWTDRVSACISVLNSFSNRSVSVFAKAYAVNVFVLSKLWYVAPVYPNCAKFIVPLVRAIFAFIWSGSELVKRDILYLPMSEGGIGLIHIESKVLALSVAAVLNILDVTGDPPPVFWLLKFFSAFKFRRFVASLWSNNTPHVTDVPPEYSRIFDICCSIFNDSVPFDCSLSCARLYGLIRSVLVPNFVFHDHSQFGPLLWKSLSSKFLSGRQRDLAWRVMWGALKTNARLRTWGIGNGLCPRGCGCLETVVHIFWECPLVRPLWDWFARICLPLNWSPNRFFVLYGVSGPPDPSPCVSAWVVASIIKQKIWLDRNKIVFEKSRPDPQSLLVATKSAIRFRINLEFKSRTRSEFSRVWCSRAYLVSVNGSSLSYRF